MKVIHNLFRAVPIEKGRGQCISGSYQNYQNGAVSNQLTMKRGESVLGVLVNLLTCRVGVALYALCAPHSLISKNIYINMPPPKTNTT